MALRRYHGRAGLACHPGRPQRVRRSHRAFAWYVQRSRDGHFFKRRNFRQSRDDHQRARSSHSSLTTRPFLHRRGRRRGRAIPDILRSQYRFRLACADGFSVYAYRRGLAAGHSRRREHGWRGAGLLDRDGECKRGGVGYRKLLRSRGSERSFGCQQSAGANGLPASAALRR